MSKQMSKLGNCDIDISTFAIAKSESSKFWTGLNETKILEQTFKII